MIQMIKGVYTHSVEGLWVDETAQTPPFSLPAKEEARLVEKGCAVYVGTPVPVGSADKGLPGKKKKEKKAHVV